MNSSEVWALFLQYKGTPQEFSHAVSKVGPIKAGENFQSLRVVAEHIIDKPIV